MLCVNADGSVALPPRCIGKSVTPRCFRDARFAHHGNFYTHQAEGSMDSDGFNSWIKWWHGEAQKFCPGSKLLITDNCSGHSVNANVSDVRVITLSPRTNALHQPLDLGLIGACKVRYRSLLLRSVISAMESKFK